MNIDLVIRITAFIGIFAIMALWETMVPRRHWQTDKTRRWGVNLALVGVNTLFIRILLASGAFGASIIAGKVEVGSSTNYIGQSGQKSS